MTPSGMLFLVSGVTDMRKSIKSLSLIVAEQLGINPFSEAWFMFFNRWRDKLKILFWDTYRFWLYYHRLEKAPSSGHALIPKALSPSANFSFIGSPLTYHWRKVKHTGP